MCDAVAIRNAIERLSLAWPHIVFVLTESLSEGTQSLLNVKTSNSVQDRWRALFGPNLVNVGVFSCERMPSTIQVCRCRTDIRHNRIASRLL